jgi:hypothetical protein
MLSQLRCAGEKAEMQSSSPVHNAPKRSIELFGMGAVVLAENTAREQLRLKDKLDRRIEELKKKGNCRKLDANTNSRGGLRGMWYRLRYSLRSFLGSWKQFDNQKLEWYLKNAK